MKYCKQKADTYKKSNASGFTLIEIAIIMMIAGVIFIPLLNIYQNYYKQTFIDKTRSNIEFAQSLISTFAAKRYPCPADPTLDPNNAMYGREQIDAAGDCIVAAGKVISVDGAQTASEKVLIGAVPIRTLNQANPESYVSDDVGLDAWGNKLLYAVTLKQTKSTTYAANIGQIAAIDESLNPTAGIDRNGHFVVLSHGPNGNGAYGRYGNIVSACATGTNESENCDGDSTFMSALGVYEGSGTNPAYFDDITYFVQKSDNELWDNVVITKLDASGNPVNEVTTSIYNKNSNFVGVKTTTPTAKLDVAGDIKATNNTKVTQICDSIRAGACFDVKSISGTTFEGCSGGEVMVGISEKKAVCAPIVMQTLQPRNCRDEGKWVRGIRTDGTIICTGENL